MGKFQKKAVTLKDSWIWIVIGLFLSIVTGGVVWAYAGVAIAFDVGVKIAILGVVDLAFFIIAAIHYYYLISFVDAWNAAPQTAQGAAVFVSEDIAKTTALNGITDILSIVEKEIDAAQMFWAIYLNQATEKQFKALKDAFVGASVIVTDKPFTVKYVGKVMGVQDGKMTAIVYDNDRVKSKQEFVALLRHELSHRCLTILGVDQDGHHEIIDKSNFCLDMSCK